MRALISKYLCAAFGNLGEGDEGGVVLLPLRGCQVSREQVGGDGHDGIPSESDGQTVEALLRDAIVAALAGVLLLDLGAVPGGLVLDVEQHLHQHGEEPPDELWELAHHPGGALPGLGQGDDELDGEVARALLEAVLGLGDLQHGADDVGQLAAQEARLGAGELDEQLEGLLRGGLLAGVEGVGERAHHGGEEVLQAVAVGGGVEALDEVDGGAEGGDADVGGGGVGEGGEEEVVDGGQVLAEGVGDVVGEAGEDEEGGLLEVRGGRGGGGLEEERQQLGPGVLGQEGGRQLGDGVAELLGDGLGVLAVEGRQQEGFEGGLGGGGEARPDRRRRR